MFDTLLVLSMFIKDVVCKLELVKKLELVDLLVVMGKLT